MPGTVLSMQNIYLVKKNYANPLEGDTKPPEGDNSMKFVYHQLNYLKIWEWDWIFGRAVKTISSPGVCSPWLLLFNSYQDYLVNISELWKVHTVDSNLSSFFLNAKLKSVECKIEITIVLCSLPQEIIYGLNVR